MDAYGATTTATPPPTDRRSTATASTVTNSSSRRFRGWFYENASDLRRSNGAARGLRLVAAADRGPRPVLAAVVAAAHPAAIAAAVWQSRRFARAHRPVSRPAAGADPVERVRPGEGHRARHLDAEQPAHEGHADAERSGQGGIRRELRRADALSAGRLEDGQRHQVDHDARPGLRR